MTNDQMENCICSQETKSGLSLVSKRAYNTIAALIILCIYVSMTVPAAYAEDTEDTSIDYAVAVSETGMEAASALATMVYFPAKAAFALGGGIWRASMEGDYMVEPGNLTGEVPINFVGQDE